MSQKLYERWCAVLLLACTLCGLGSALYVNAHESLFREEFGSAVSWLVAIGAFALPIVTGATAGTLIRRGIQPKVARRIHIIEWLPLLFVRSELPGQFFIASLAILTAHTFSRSHRSGFASWTLAGSVTLALTGAATTPALHWMWIVPLTLSLAGSALILLHVRRGFAHRETLDKWSFMREYKAESSLPGPARLASYGLPFVLLTLAITPVVSFAIIEIPVPMSEARRLNSGRAQISRPQRGANPISDASQVAFDGVFPSSVGYGRGIARLRHETVMFVSAPTGVPEEDFRARAPYYLRGLVQDRFGPEQVDFASGRNLQTLSAGTDGWIDLQTSTQGPELELEIYQAPLLTREDAWNILFSSQPALEVRANRVLFHEDGVLVSLDGDVEWKRYAVRSGVDDARFWNLEGHGARHPSRRYTQLPDQPQLVDQIRAHAESITRGADNDLDRVRAVIGHFHSDYTYLLAAQDTPGLEGVLAFLKDRRGHCTDFASAATLLLRSLGISARIATGFLVGDWSDEHDAFEVTTRNGHAWVEVYFEGVGWLRVEPTPSGRREQAWRARLAEGLVGLSSWFDELGTDLSYWMSSGTDEADLKLVMQTLVRAPEALWASARRAPVATALWLIALVGAWIGLARLRSGAASESVRSTRRKQTREQDRFLNLLRTLEKRGHRRPAAQTPREFALRLATAKPEWGAIQAIVESFYRARFGGVAPSEQELAAIDSLTHLVQKETAEPAP